MTTPEAGGPARDARGSDWARGPRPGETGPSEGAEVEAGRFERLLLRAYPSAFRRRWGDQLLDFLARQRREARYRTGRLGGVRYRLEAAWDALRGGLRARIDEHRREGRTRMAGMGFELREAVRGLLRNPGFTASVALTLGLGIGAATAIYSIADWVVLRPVPGVSGPGRTVTVRFLHEGEGGGWFLVSHPDFRDLAAGADALAHLAGVHRAEAHVALSGDELPRRLPVELVTDGYFEALGAAPVLGSPPGAGTSGDPRVVVVSHRVWTSELGSDPEVLGRSLLVNGRPFTIAGVAPPGFHGPAPAERATELWASVRAHGTLIPAYPEDVLSSRGRSLYLALYGRLRDGATVEQARAQLSATRDAVVEARGEGSSLDGFVPAVERGVGVAPWVRARAETTMRILLAAAGVLLLLGCANAANLLLARASARAHELAVRRALGAGRGRIARRLLSDGVLLGVLAGVAGLALAKGILVLYDGQRLLAWLPTLETVALDGRVLLFALVVSLATGVLFSVAPAVVTARSAEGLRSGRRVASGGRALRTGLVAVQVALSLALVVGAGLLLQTVRALARVDPGLDPAGVLEASVDPGTQGYGPEERIRFWRSLTEEARTLPGVSAAGVAWASLYGLVASNDRVRPEGTPQHEALETNSNYVGPGFIAATGITLRAGRDFRPDELFATPPRDVVIVTEGLARALFGTDPGAAVGRRVALGHREGRSFEIVGVIGDVRSRRVHTPDDHLLLEPFGQIWNPTWGTLYVRGSHSATSLEASLRALVRDMDPGLPLYDVQPLEARVRESFAEERLVARLTTLFGVLALLLLGLGLYGVVSYKVSTRTRELGIRVALGAPSGSVRRMVLRHGLGLVARGLPAGFLLAAVTSKVVATRLWGVTPFDPSIWGTATGTLLAAAVAASWIPAWRATRVDPVRALRTEA